MDPLRFEPVYKDYVWGGHKIVKKYGRKTPLKKVAESWEVSVHPDGMSVVAEGPFKGKTLRQLLNDHAQDLLGYGQDFQLLIKIIDSAENMSVQVHPDEATAPLFKGDPKTEAWVILEAEPGAFLYAGLKEGVTKEKFQKAMKKGTVVDLLQKIKVHPGDVIYIPGGIVHCICKGILLLEVQQSSNTTYRIYDWGRTDRELHQTQALGVINFSRSDNMKMEPKKLENEFKSCLWSLLDTRFFTIEKVEIFQEWELPKGFQILFCTKGNARLSNGMSIEMGQTVVVPANSPNLTIKGKSEILRITPPPPLPEPER